jgi:hypothetical protein
MLTFTSDGQEDYTARFLDVSDNEAPDKVDIAFIAKCSNGDD